jgi:single-strand DNA-binding protein
VTDTNITIVGNLTADPDLKYVSGDKAVANFTIASTPRKFDATTKEWVDGDTLFMRASLWKEAAENAADSLRKGQRVIVTGRLKQRSYEKDGQTRSVVELEAEEIGPSLRYATAQVSKKEFAGKGSKPAGDGWGSGFPDEQPPF